MEQRIYTGKTLEEAIKTATLDLQELEENLIINEKEVEKGGLFKSKKVEISVFEKRNVIDFIKKYLQKLVKDLGFTANIEVKNKEEVPIFSIYSDKDSLLIGKNGKNMQALSIITSGAVKKEIDVPFKFSVDVGDYKVKREKSLISLAKRTAREVTNTKIEAKLDSMNSYERRIIHNALTDYKQVYTESIGEEPNRAVVIKPVED